MAMPGLALGRQLTADPHAALWRGIGGGQARDFANARHDLAVSQSGLRLYPEEWQTQARLARAETGLAQGDLASANDALDQLTPQLTPRQPWKRGSTRPNFSRGAIHMNERSRARTLEQTDYRRSRFRQPMRGLRSSFAARKIKPDEAIKTYEQLHYRWRGDDLELKILAIGSLYLRKEIGAAALPCFVRLAHFPKADLARSGQRMRRPQRSLPRRQGRCHAPHRCLARSIDFIDLTPSAATATR